MIHKGRVANLVTKGPAIANSGACQRFEIRPDAPGVGNKLIASLLALVLAFLSACATTPKSEVGAYPVPAQLTAGIGGNKPEVIVRGLSSVDPNWKPYVQYLSGMVSRINGEWDHILATAKNFPKSGTAVSVKFRLNSDGRVAEIIDVKGNTTAFGEQACLAAITEPAPFGKWSPDMIAKLGDSQVLGFTFYYE
jgi:hypothetical protein